MYVGRLVRTDVHTHLRTYIRMVIHLEISVNSDSGIVLPFGGTYISPYCTYLGMMSDDACIYVQPLPPIVLPARKAFYVIILHLCIRSTL